MLNFALEIPHQHDYSRAELHASGELIRSRRQFLQNTANHLQDVEYHTREVLASKASNSSPILIGIL